MKKSKLAAWFAFSRPPFHIVSVLPYVLGNVLALRLGTLFRWDVFWWGACGVVLVMLTTYFAGEYWDIVEDSISSESGSSRFSGGSQVVPRGLLPRRAALLGSCVSLPLAVFVGAILQFVYDTGLWTIPLGLVGILGGFFYSAKPIRWVSRGLGEVWIAFCYGWLPIAVGYYLQTGQLIQLGHWLAVPVGFTIFNVILLNEFSYYDADLAAGKADLVVRLGRERAARLYGLVMIMSWVAVMMSLSRGVPTRMLWFYLPFQMLSLFLVFSVMSGRWNNRHALEKLCAANLLVNLGTTAAYIFAFVS